MLNRFLRASTLAPFAMTLACLSFCGCKTHATADQEELRIAKAAIDGFMADWGLPVKIVQQLPKQCYINDRFASATELRNPYFSDRLNPQMRQAVEDLLRKPAGGLVRDLGLPCKPLRDAFRMVPSSENAAGAGIGVLQISRVGMDRTDAYAVVLLREARADLAGSTWAIFLRREGSEWRIERRELIAQS